MIIQQLKVLISVQVFDCTLKLGPNRLGAGTTWNLSLYLEYYLLKGGKPFILHTVFEHILLKQSEENLSA
jgi:hypothetical protein